MVALTTPRSVSLASIHAFVDQVGGRSKLDGMSALDVWTQLVAPKSSHEASPTSDGEPMWTEAEESVQQGAANWLVCHDRNALFLDVVDTLESRSSASTGKPCLFWLPAFHLDLARPPSTDNNESDVSPISAVSNMLVLWPHDSASELLSCPWSAHWLEVAASAIMHTEVIPLIEFIQQDETPLLSSYTSSLAAISSWHPDEDATATRSFLHHTLQAAVDAEIQRLPQPSDRATASFALGLALHEANELPAAKTYYERAIALFPPASREFFNCSRQLALLIDKTAPTNDQLSTATSLQDILEVQRTLFGDHDPDTVDTMVALGYTYAVHCQPTLAWHLLEKAWHVRVQRVGADHTSTLHVMELLASQSFALHQYNHAAATYASCLKHYDKAPTPANKAARLTCANNLAAVYMCQGQYAHARALWTECLEQDIQTHGLDSDLTLVSMANVAEVQRCLGEYMHAEWLVLSMWDRAKQLHGDSSEVALLGLSTLGMVYRNQGSKEAAECLEQAFVKRKHRYDHDGVGRDAACKALYQWYGYCVDHLRFESLSNIESFEKNLHDLDCDSETWHNERCHGCTKEIQGDVATCPQCVAATFQYCRACAAKSNKAKRRCAHTARLVMRKPPSRHLLEQRLQLLAMTDQHDLYDDWFERYEDYCNRHHVPHAKRLMQPRDEHKITATCFACVPWL